VIIASVLIWTNPGGIKAVGCREGLNRAGEPACVTNWELADPACTILFACLVLYTTWGVLKSSISVLMMATPEGVDIDEIEFQLKRIPDVVAVHALHVWEVRVRVRVRVRLRVHALHLGGPLWIQGSCLCST